MLRAGSLRDPAPVTSRSRVPTPPPPELRAGPLRIAADLAVAIVDYPGRSPAAIERQRSVHESACDVPMTSCWHATGGIARCIGERRCAGAQRTGDGGGRAGIPIAPGTTADRKARVRRPQRPRRSVTPRTGAARGTPVALRRGRSAATKRRRTCSTRRPPVVDPAAVTRNPDISLGYKIWQPCKRRTETDRDAETDSPHGWWSESFRPNPIHQARALGGRPQQQPPRHRTMLDSRAPASQAIACLGA